MKRILLSLAVTLLAATAGYHGVLASSGVRERPAGHERSIVVRVPLGSAPAGLEGGAEEHGSSPLSNSSKRAIAQYAYAVLDSYYAQTEAPPPPAIDLSNFAYDRLYVTCYHQTQIRGSQSGSSPKDAPHRLFRDIDEAVRECVEDRRFGGTITERQIPETSLVFNFMRNKTRLAGGDLTFLEENIDLGIHAVSLTKKNKSVFFKESVAIAKNYSHNKLFERLCKKAKLPRECYLEQDRSIFRYDTVTFRVDRAGNIQHLFRYDVVISEDEITGQTIHHRLELAYHWFRNHINPDTGRVEYIYYPSRNKYSRKQNHVRALASGWGMVEVQSYLNKHQLSDPIHETLAYYFSFFVERDRVAYIEIDGEAKIAYNAFLILVLLSYPDYPNTEVLVRKLADGLLHQQNENGSFGTHFFSERNTGVDYYPGEAMLALIKLYYRTGDKRYRVAVERAFPFYRDYWRSHRTTAFVPWHTQAYYLLFRNTKDLELAEFVFEMNDWLITNYQIFESKYPDELGGFPREAPRYSTASYLEGINDVYALAVAVGDEARAQKYRESIRKGTRFLFQLQITERNAFYLKVPHRAIGGFRKTLTRNTQRNDYTQHAIFALIKAIENNIFPDS